MRPDIFQQDVIEVLSRLRDGAPAHKFEETREIMMEEFGVEISDMFLSFDTKAVASGSIAQVYRGKLRPEYAQKMDIRDSQGNLVDEVAIKIRHPGVLAETWIDLDIIYAIVDRVPGLCIPFNKEELKLMIQYQIDFRFEGHYLSRFRRNFSEEIQQGYIAFPYVSEESLRQAVLIESWAQGQTVGDIFTEVGDLFRPIIKKIDTPIVRHHKTLFESIRAQASSIMAIMKNYSVNGLYFLADKFDIKVDTYNAIRNRNYRSIDTKSPIANLLRAILPPRGRIGEKNYKWDPSLTQEENMRAEQKKILAYTLFDMFIKMFIRDNLIHADLHAGNVLYDHKSFKHTATVLDAGMTVALESDIMRQFGLFLRAICDGDPNSLVEACSRFEVNLPNAEFLTLLAPLSNDHSQQWSRLPIPNGSGVGLLATNSIIRSRFHHDINQIFERFYSNSAVWGADLPIAENVSIGDVVGQVLLAMQTHGIILRGDVAASIMAMSVIEGLLRQLDPELDIVVNALPYFLRYNSPFRG
jgi:predicted unusual protein kinase regulating ubiquinone biosynthesis (AarF/ABC1/UbiB family)